MLYGFNNLLTQKEKSKVHNPPLLEGPLEISNRPRPWADGGGGVQVHAGVMPGGVQVHAGGWYKVTLVLEEELLLYGITLYGFRVERSSLRAGLAGARSLVARVGVAPPAPCVDRVSPTAGSTARLVYNELCVGEYAALELEADTGAGTARPYCWPCCCAVVLLVPLALTSWQEPGLGYC